MPANGTSDTSNPESSYTDESISQQSVGGAANSSEPLSKFRNPLEAMRPGEQIVCEVKRHPIGMFGAYAIAVFLLALLVAIGIFIVPDMAPNLPKGKIYGFTAIAFLGVGIIEAIFLYISHVVYWGNRWIVTTDSITQISQISLFSKQSSQLSMSDLEDITSEQNGVLPQLLGYGLIWVETAGERDKFRFPFCPNPNEVASTILKAREAYDNAHHERASE